MSGASHGLAVAAVMARREWLRLRRQPARIAAAIGTPCLVWLFMSSGFARAFGAQLGEESYAAFLLPGMMTMVALFGAVFSSIALIEDRNEGWLHAALVAPAPRWATAIGRITGAAVVTWVQAALLLPMAPLVGIHPGAAALAEALAALGATCLGMTAVGAAFAWRSETTAGFHAVMNLLLMPLWLLSGSLFHAGGAATWLAWITRVNPMSWCTEAVREPLLHGSSGWPLAASAAFALAATAVATRLMTAPSRRA